MSITRFDPRRYSKGKPDMYVIFSSFNEDGEMHIHSMNLKDGKVKTLNKKKKSIPVINFCGEATIECEDWCEVMFRIMERAGVNFSLDDLNKIRKEMSLPKLKKIDSDEEYRKKAERELKKTLKEASKLGDEFRKRKNKNDI